MAQTIKLKRSNTSGTKPTTSSLALGEIALNTKDGLFFLRRHVDGTNSNDTIRAYTPEYLTEYDSQIDVTVTVDTKTAAHPQYGNGSSNGFLLDGLEGPFLVLVPGNTYRFDQSDSSNSSHPLRFYYESDKTTSYTTGVTTNGTAGSSGAYTEIAVTTSTPSVLYYQCSSHSLMGSGAYCGGGTIVEDQLAANSVTSAKIAANAVGSSEIAANAITSSELAANSITSTHITSGVVIEADVADNAVTSAKIAANAVGASEIAANAVGASEIAANAVSTSEIASNSITSTLIAANQVGISELNVSDGTSGQALTTDGNGTLSFSTVASSLAGASDTNISSPSSGQVLVYDGTDSFDNVSISGDATLSNTGALTIAANAIEASMIAANAVGASEIAANSVGIDELNVTDGTSGQVLTTDGAGTLSFSTVSGGGSQNLFSTIAVSGQSDIVADATTDTLTVAAGSGISLTTNASTDTLTITATGGGLSANAVTSAYLASNAVLARHISANAVGASEIAANAVGSSEIAANAVGSTQLAASGVTAGTYGSSTASPQLTVDADGRITSVTNTTISSSGGGSYGFNQQVDLDEITGDGSTVTFDTGVTILSENNTIVFIDGVYQEKGTYSTNGSEITFSTAPPNGTSVEIMHFHQVTTGGGFAHNEFDGDGSTTGFTLSTTPSAETDLIVFIDGVYQNRDSFSTSGTTLTFDTAPGNGTKIIAYTISGVITGKSNITNTFNGDNSTTDFTLTLNPNDENNTNVFIGGVYQPKSTYSVSGTTLSFSEAPPTGTGNIEVIISQITTTTQLGVNALDGQTFNGDFELTGELTSGEFIGDLRGAQLFKAQAGENLTKGQVVYISGISGNTTVVSLADADDAAKMPAFGIVAATTTSGQPVDIYTSGILSSIDTSSYSEGDELFVSTTAGALTDTPPTGETAAIQKIAKVTRSDNLSGSIFITGAGRSNAVSNLDDGDIFIGNASNQAVTASLNTKIEDYLDAGTSTPTLASLNVTTTTTDDSVTITTTEDSSAAAPVVTLKRNSASPADADYLGQIKFKGENDADQEVVYGKITGKIGDNTDTTEDGIIEFANIKDGTQTITVRLNSDEMQLINSTGLNVAGTTVLSGLTYPTSDGTNGQVLQTNGGGTLSFGTISGYTDSDVETYISGGTATPIFSNTEIDGTIKLDGNYPTGTGNVALGDTALDSLTSGAYNVAIGGTALTATTSGSNNNGVGYGALSALTDGTHNNAFGTLALDANTSGNYNTGIGTNALGSNTTASNNTAVGYASLGANTTAINNAAFGSRTLEANTTGALNAALGTYALLANTTGSNNTAVGVSTLESNTTGDQNVAVGTNALDAGTSASFNTAVGYNAMTACTESYQVAFGHSALAALTTGVRNAAFGAFSLDANTTGNANNAFGYNTLSANTTGYQNCAFGDYVLQSNTTGLNNTAVGSAALASNTTASNNCAFGKDALLANSTGTQNNAYGMASLQSCTTGNYNVGVGQATLANLTTGSNNTAIGDNAMQFGTTEYENVAVGVNAGRNYAGRGAVSVGYQAAYSQTASSTVAIGEYAAYDSTTSDDSVYVGRLCGENVTTGYTNVMMGDRAGQLTTTGYANTCIGYKAGDNITSGYNHTMVGQNVQPAYASGSSGEIGIGGGLTTNGTGYFTVGVGTSKGYYLYGSTNGFTAGSDERLKEEITDSTVGLDFINDLRPRTFKWRKRKDIPSDMPQYQEGSEERHLKLEKVQLGMIAQEVKEAIDNHPELPAGFSGWTTDVEGTQCLDYVGFVQPLIKAVQELSAKVKELEEKLNV